MHPRIGRRASERPLSISQADLEAYAADTLPAERRAVIEGYLACNPDVAAEVMQQRHRLSRAAQVAGSPLRGARFRLSALALCGLFCALGGWALAEGLDDDGPFRDLSLVPEYVDDALRSLRVTELRIAMNTQFQTPVLDADEIERATRIRLPALPAEWRLVDTQVYPSEIGPSVSLLVETPERRKIGLYAVLADTRVNATPKLEAEGGGYAAYWESGGAAYVLTTEGAAGDLLAQATQLSAGS